MEDLVLHEQIINKKNIYWLINRCLKIVISKNV